MAKTSNLPVECCNERHNTTFCPHCGKPLATNQPLAGLLHHVRVTARVRRRAAGAAADAASDVLGHTQCRRSMSAAHAADKWESWERALTELLADKDNTND